MKYHVIYSPTVVEHIRHHVRYLTEQHVSAETIERWYDDLFRVIADLEEMPRRYPADLMETERQGFEVRKLTFRRRYVLHFRVNDERAVVEVLSFIHGARRKEV